MDVPQTVKAALEDRPVDGAVCLEAGAGVGNTTAGLLATGADRVYAVTNDPEHAATVRERVARAESDRAAVLEADLRAIPLPDDSIDLITAHGLFNVVPRAWLGPIVAALTRVAAPDCHLVVDDYDPLPADAAMRDLFAVENAASEFAYNRPALTFYPADLLKCSFEEHGWAFERERTLLDPVPWTESHVSAHTDATRSAAADLSAELREPLVAEAERLAADIGAESAGRMYSIAMRQRSR